MNTERLEMPVVRRLAAILAADVAGYSRLMGTDEEGTLARRIAASCWNRRLPSTTVGSSSPLVMVCWSNSPAMSTQCAARSNAMPRSRSMSELSFGSGSVLAMSSSEGDDVYCDGVNVAARLGSLAEPAGVFISNIVREEVPTRGAECIVTWS